MLNVNKRSQSLAGKLDIKRLSPSILYLSHIWDTFCRDNQKSAYAITIFQACHDDNGKSCILKDYHARTYFNKYGVAI